MVWCRRLIVVLGAAMGLAELGGCMQGWHETGQASDRGSPPAIATEIEPAAAPQVETFRRAAVAGQFYAGSREQLAEQVDELLAEAKSAPVKGLRGLVSPHAGYEFSGPIAAVSYKQLEGRGFRTVIVMAPSHYALFEGASIPEVDAYKTPLGLVPLSPRAKELAKLDPMLLCPANEVDRAGSPHGREHSLEVQLPFLQRTLNEFTLVPIVFGQVEPKKVARALEGVVDDKTLVVASSDFSHYNPYDVACQLDAASIRAICDLDVDWFEQSRAGPSEEPCGRGPILALVYLAKKNGWKAKLLDYRNSGDTSGEKSRVVGYAAIAFFDPKESEKPEGPKERTAAAEPDSSPLSPEDGKILLDLAEKAVREVVNHDARNRGMPPWVDEAEMPPSLTQPRACFVTLTKNGDLRGCIGSIFPREPLYRAVVERARSAAVEDARFPPVRPEELDDLEIEVSVLTIPERLGYRSPQDLLAALRPGVDGVVLQVGPGQATYLPQVWEQLPDAEDFLRQLSQKAGLPPEAWRSPQAVVLTYQVEAFQQAQK